MTVFDSKSRTMPRPALPDGASPAPLTGPLTRVARQGAGDGGPDWQQVAQQVAAAYHGLDGHANPGDLLTALKCIPDADARERAVSLIAGPDAEGLRLALQGQGERQGGAQPIPLRRRTPTTTPQPLTARTGKQTPARTTGQDKMAARGKKETADTQTGIVRPAGRDTATGKGKKTVGTSKTPLPAARRAAPTKAKAAAGRREAPAKAPAKGKAEQVGDLHVVNRDALAALGLTAAGLTEGNRVALNRGEWQATQGQVRRALQKRAEQDRTPQEPTGDPRTAESVPVRPTVAQALPSAVIPAAQIKAANDANRRKNSAALNASLSRARKTRAQLNGALGRARPQITQAQKAAEAQVQAALSATLAQLSGAAARARSSVNASASQARSGITASHRTTVAGIRTDTAQKRTAILAALRTLDTQLRAKKARLSADVTGEFRSAQGRLRGIGGEVAGTARATGERMAAQYDAEPVPSQNFFQRVANGGDYYKDKHAAKVKAARDTGNQYADGMVQAGQDQANKLGDSLPEALAAHATLLQSYQGNVDKLRTSLLDALTQQQQQAITAANTQKTALLGSVAQQQAQALGRISSTAASLRAQASAQASQQRAALRSQSAQAQRSLQGTVQGAQRSLDGRIAQMQADGHRQLDQDSGEFVKAMKGFEDYVTRGCSAAETSCLKAAQTAATQLKAGARPAAQAIAGLGRSGAQGLTQTAAQTTQGIRAAATQGAAQLKAALARHRQGTLATQKQATTQAAALSSGFDTDAGKILKDTTTQLGGLDDPFRTALNGVLSSGSGETQAEVPAIEAAARKAADAVKPRWKAVLSVVIDIVIVVVTIVAIAALTAVLGPVGLILAGMAIGALGAVVGQGLKDLVNGEFSGWQAYGIAAVGGAIGGAFGGMGGAAGTALAGKAVGAFAREGLASSMTKLAVEAGVGTAFDLAGQVATGYTNQAAFGLPYDFKSTFSAQNVLMSAGMNSAGYGLAALPGAAKFVRSRLGSLDLPGKGLAGSFKNALSDVRLLQSLKSGLNTVAETKLLQGGLGALKTGVDKTRAGVRTAGNAVKALPGKVKAGMRDFAEWSGGKLNDAGAYLGGRKDDLGAWLSKNGKDRLKSTLGGMAEGAGKKSGINMIADYVFDGKLSGLKDSVTGAVEGGVKGGAKKAFQEADPVAGAPAPSKVRQALKVMKDSAIGAGSGVVSKFINNLMFTGRIGSRAEYLISAIEGGLVGAGGKLSDLSSAALLKAVLKDQQNRYVKVFGKFASETGLKSAFDYGMKNVANVVNAGLFGPAYTWKALLNGKEIFKVMANAGKFRKLAGELGPMIKSDLGKAWRSIHAWNTEQLERLGQTFRQSGEWVGQKANTVAGGAKQGLDDLGRWGKDRINDVRRRAAEFTGSKKAPLREGTLGADETASGRVSRQDGQTTVAHHPLADDLTRQVHLDEGVQFRRDHSPVGRATDWVQSKVGGAPKPKVGTEAYYLTREAEKAATLAARNLERAEKLPLGPERDALMERVAGLKNAEQDFRSQLGALDQSGGKVGAQDVEGKLKYPDVNAKAREVGLPDPPEGHYYLETPGRTPPFQLRALPGKAASLAEVDARYQIVQENGQYRLKVRETLTGEERAQQRIEQFRDNPYFRGTQARYAGLDDAAASFHAMYEERLRQVLGDKVPPEFFDDILQRMNATSLKGDAWEKEYRALLRDKILRRVDEHLPGEQYHVLHEWLGAQPNNGAKGSLFQEYQERHLPPGMKYVKPEANDTSVAYLSQDGVPYRSKADSIMEVTRRDSAGGPPEGTFLVEDKSGRGAFDEEQFKRYSEMLTKGDLTTNSEKKFDGLVYFFDSRSSLDSAGGVFLAHPELGRKLHVAYLNQDGVFVWVVRAPAPGTTGGI